MRTEPWRPGAGERAGISGIEMEALTGLDLDGLRARWRSETGRAAPRQLAKALLLRVLAYRMQASRHGDLDADTVRFLDRIAAEHKPDRNVDRNPGRQSSRKADLALPDRALVCPGALLVREWGGVMHRVMARAEGFAWNGTTYASLSQVARAITGTRWNGPRFFGLRKVGISKEPSR